MIAMINMINICLSNVQDKEMKQSEIKCSVIKIWHIDKWMVVQDVIL